MRRLPLLLTALVLCLCSLAAAAEGSGQPGVQPVDMHTPMYYLPGGSSYHLDPACSNVAPSLRPMTAAFPYSEVNSSEYEALLPCTVCGAPMRESGTPVWVAGQRVIGYRRETPVNMPDGKDYLTVDIGVTTWRGDSFNSNAASGVLSAAPAGLQLAWLTELDHGDAANHGYAYGSQPLIVQWPLELRSSMNLTDAARNTKALKEVILPGLDGQIRFLNLKDGTPTRKAIHVGYPLLSTATVHPLAYPLLITGQSSAALAHGSGSIGLHFHELLTQRSVHFIDGRMPGLTERKPTGAFRTSTLIDRTTGTAVSLSIDGFLYTETFLPQLSIDSDTNQVVRFEPGFGKPVITRVTDNRISGAPVMSGSRIWFGTLSSTTLVHGGIVCVDTTTMQQVWHRGLGAPVFGLTMERDADGQLWLYAGTGYDHGEPRNARSCRLLCLNADTGEIRWEQSAAIFPDSTRSSGVIATPLCGQGALENLVFFTVTETAGHNSGSTLLALDKQTGGIVWQQTLACRATASPVAVYDADGNGWLIQADEGNGWMSPDGTSTSLHLLSGLTGEILHSLPLEGGRPSSPAVYGDTLVIGTSGEFARVYGVSITGAP